MNTPHHASQANPHESEPAMTASTRPARVATVTLSEAADQIARRAMFTAASMKGHTVHPTGRPTFGRLPAEHKARITAALSAGKFVYLVFSYSTVIGYSIGRRGALIVPPVTYSQTTSRHQGIASSARFPR